MERRFTSSVLQVPSLLAGQLKDLGLGMHCMENNNIRINSIIMLDNNN